MGYNIAVASKDGINIDSHFGSSNSFLIYKVNDDKTFEKIGERLVLEPKNIESKCIPPSDCGAGSCGPSSGGCGSSSGGCGSSGGGCGGGGQHDPELEKKVQSIIDCRAVLSSKLGPKAEKQLSAEGIVPFEISLTIEEAIKTLVKYFSKVDSHENLRNLHKEK